MTKLLLAVLLLAAPAVQEGANYESEDLDAFAPGPHWRLQTAVPNAPSVRGAYVHPRRDGEKDHSSLITFAVDPDPGRPLEAYIDDALRELSAAPLSFQVKKKGAFKSKGRAAIRADYTDKDGVRHFSQVAMETPRGGIVVAVLQAPDAEIFGKELPVFLRFVETLSPKPPPKAAKAPGKAPKKRKKGGR